MSSSTISLNGQIVFGPSNFNQNVAYLEKEIVLNESENNLEVILKGKPGGKIRIHIVQEVDAEGAAFVGSEGGVVEVVDPESPLFEFKIEIPEGSVDKDTIWRIIPKTKAVIPTVKNLKEYL